MGFRRVTLLSIPLFAAGCHDNGFEVTRVAGRVVCNGEPVSAGTLYFTPIKTGDDINSGRVGMAYLNPEEPGVFALTTYDLYDGAIIGRHTISYMPPEFSEQGPPPSRECSRMKPFEFEVPPEGFDSLTIELSEGKATPSES